MADSAWITVHSGLQYKILNCGANGEIIVNISKIRFRYKSYTYQQIIAENPELAGVQYGNNEIIIYIQLSDDENGIYNYERIDAKNLTVTNGFWEFTSTLTFDHVGTYRCYIQKQIGGVCGLIGDDPFTNKKAISVPAPRIELFEALRCDASGALKADGTRAKFGVKWTGFNVGGNTMTAKIQELINGTWTTLYSYTDLSKTATFIGSKTYGVDARPKFRLIIQDKFSPATAMESILESPSKLMTGDQRSICFGGESSYNGTAEFKMPIWYHGKELLDFCYPINRIIATSDNRNPGTYLGGTWVQYAQGRVLIGQGTGSDGEFSETFPAGSTGGEYKHRLTESEMYPHSHYLSSDHTAHSFAWGGSGKNVFLSANAAGGNGDGNKANTKHSEWNQTESVGNGSAHNNIQPYQVVYYWRRCA